MNDRTDLMEDTIDFKLNYPSLQQEAVITRDFFRRFNEEDFSACLPFASNACIQNTHGLADLLGIRSGELSPVAEVIMCNSGNHALFAILQTLREEDRTIFAEQFTYSTCKLMIAALHYKSVSVSMDEEGMIPEDLHMHVRSAPRNKILYIQPTIHNPTCSVMPLERRKKIVQIAKEADLLIIEDDAYRFLHPDPPPSFAELLPEQTIHICSLSKPFNSLIKTAFIIVPKKHKAAIANNVRLTAGGTSSLLEGFADFLLRDRVLQKLIEQKREEALRRRQIVLPFLTNFSFCSFPTAFHFWLRLPAGVKAGVLTDLVLKHGVQIVPGTDNALCEDGENYIRIAIGMESNDARLQRGFSILTKYLRA
jgi:DNA-binding transcriptional MocR family regulator